MKNQRIWIDKTTGTWGMVNDLMVAEVDDLDIAALEQINDSAIIEYAKEIGIDAAGAIHRLITRTMARAQHRNGAE